MLDANPHHGVNALRTTRSTKVDRLVLKTIVPTDATNVRRPARITEQRVGDNAFHLGNAGH
jgi:hypothetical protein